METLNQRIKELRKQKGWTQSQLAEKLYLSDKAISKWEVGEANPDISLLPQIATLFDVTIDYLLTGKIEEEKISLDDMDSLKRLSYLIKKDDVENFVKYGYTEFSNRTIFRTTIYYGQNNYKTINLNVWYEILDNNANNILWAVVDNFFEVNNFNVSLGFLVSEIYDELIIKAIDCDRADVLEKLGFLYTKVDETKSNEKNCRSQLSQLNLSTFPIPFTFSNNSSSGIDSMFSFEPIKIRKETLNYIFENKEKAPNCYNYLISSTNLYIKGERGPVYLYTTLEDDIINCAIENKDIELLKKYYISFNKELISISKFDNHHIGASYNLRRSYFLNNYNVVGRMYNWSKKVIDTIISLNDVDFASKLVEHNRLYIKERNELWFSNGRSKDKSLAYVISISEIERQAALANNDLTEQERFLMNCIKDSCIDPSYLKESRDLKFVKKILDEYPYCPYEYIYMCLTKGRQKDLFKYFIDHDDEKNAKKLMLGKDYYQKLLVQAVRNYRCNLVEDNLIDMYNISITCYNNSDDAYKLNAICEFIEDIDLFDDNPIIHVIKKIKNDIYMNIEEIINEEKIAKQETLERAQATKGLTKEYFNGLLESSGFELFMVKLCALFDCILKYDYHCLGDDFSDRLNDYFNTLQSNAPKSRSCDDGWGYEVLDTWYENNTVIPENNKIKHLRDLFYRLRTQRNNIAHVDQQSVNELSIDEMNECLEYVFSINKKEDCDNE